MSVPNIGPEHFDGDPDGIDTPRRGNPALVYRDERLTDCMEMEAASTRATTVSHRFGGVRYALTRHHGLPPEAGPDAGGGPHASH